MTTETLTEAMQGSIEITTSEVDETDELVSELVTIHAHPMIREAVEEIVKQSDNDYTSKSQFVREALREFSNQPFGEVDGERYLGLIPTGSDKTNKMVCGTVTPTTKQKLKYVKESPMTPYESYIETGTVAIAWYFEEMDNS